MRNILLLFGILVLVSGVFISVLVKGRMPLLPGDILLKLGNHTIYIPLGTALIISFILTALFSKFIK